MQIRFLRKCGEYIKKSKKHLTIDLRVCIISLAFADVAHLVERHLAKVEVASSSLVIRSNLISAGSSVG